jgi:hypothetical protein
MASLTGVKGTKTMPFNLLFRLIALSTLTLTLAACTPRDGEALWLDYLVRLERLSGATLPAAEPARRARYPAHRLLVQPVAEQRTGLIRYVSLLDCDLMQLVSARNSSLGRVQAGSLRLDHELRFIAGAEICLADERLSDDPDMRDWLQAITLEKREDLSRRGWNLTFAGPELNHFFRQRPVPAEQPAPLEWPATVRALEQLTVLVTRLATSPPASVDEAVEQALETLDKSSAAGQVLDGLALARRDLSRAASLLDQIDTARLCPHGRASERARHLHNVFISHYAGRIQPWLADLSRAAAPLAEATLALRHAQSAILDSPLDDLLAAQFGGEGLLPGYQQALMQHSLAWQRVLGACGLMPGQGNGPATKTN